MKKTVLAVSIAAIVAGCAKQPNEIAATPTVTSPYLNMSCRQLSDEANVLNQEVAKLTGQQAQVASNDAVATGVALFLFWPAIFFIGHGSDVEPQLAAAKGQQEAIQRAWTQKGC